MTRPRPLVVGSVFFAALLLWLHRAPSASSPDLAPEQEPVAGSAHAPAARQTRLSNSESAGEAATAPSADPAALAAAQARREHLLALLDTDPARALAESLSFADYAALPAELRPYYERPFAALAALDVIPNCGDPSAEGPSLLLRHEGRHYSAVATGTRVAASSRAARPLHGFILGDRALVADTPLAILAPADAPLFAHLRLGQPDPSRDFATGAPLGPEPVVAIAGDRRLLFTDRASAEAFNERLAELDTRPGPRGGAGLALTLPYSTDASSGFDWAAAELAVTQASAAWTQTAKAVFFIRAEFPDVPGTLAQNALATQLNTRVASALHAMSYGKTTVQAEVSAQFIRLPQPSSAYTYDSHLLYDHALARYRELHGAASLDAYDIVGVQFPAIGLGYAGLATIGGTRHWLQGDPADTVIVHEFGHNYGVGHAHAWVTYDGSVAGGGTHHEYGDLFDVMGSGAAPEAHFHPQAKALLNWLEPARLADADVSGSGTYRLHRFDHPATTGQLRALRVTKDPSATPSQIGRYWVGYRPGISANATLPHGAYVLWQRPGFSSSSLLDLTPGSSAGHADAALPLGHTYSDPVAGLHLTPLATGGSGADAWLDLHVELGHFPDNRPPAASFTPTPAVAARTPHSFTVSASDPDGDTLAYAWDFGDGSPSLNSATRNHAWSVGGDYEVTVRVSDRRGGVTTRSATITVSDPLLSWHTSTVASSRSFRTVAHLRGRHFIGGHQHLHSSLDRATWTETHLGLNYHANAFAADARAFVAVGLDYDFSLPAWIGVVHRSLDGRLWEKVALPATVPELRSVAADGSGTLVAVGHGGTLLRSADSGASWTLVPAPGGATPQLRSVAHGGGLFMAVGDRSVFTSPDGLAWTDRSASTLLSPAQNFHSVLHADGAWYAGGWYSGIHRSTDEGRSWSRVALPSPHPHTIESLVAGPGGLLLASATRHDGAPDAPALLVSTDGLRWSAAPGPSPIPATASLAYADGAFHSASGASGQLARSATLSPQNQPPASATFGAPATGAARQPLAFSASATDADGDTLRYLWDFGDGSAYREGAQVSHAFAGGGTYQVTLHVSDSRGGLVTTTRTLTLTEPLAEWTPRASGTSATLHAVARAPSGRLVAVGSGGGTYRVSTDGGATWGAGGQLGANLHLHGIHHADGAFVAVGEDWVSGAWRGVIYGSADGLAWTLRHTTQHPLQSITHAGGVFVAVGQSGEIQRSADARTWTQVPSGTTQNLYAVTHGGGVFLAAGGTGNGVQGTVLSSPDGQTWTNRSAGLGTGQGLFSAAYAGDRFLVSGFSARIRHSTDGGRGFTAPPLASNPWATGFARLHGVTLAVARDVANGYAAQNLVSLDGAQWTALPTPAFAERRAVIALADSFLTVGANGQIWQSAPLVAATPPPAPVAGYASWRERHFAGEPSALSVPGADADGDGVSNLAEYLAGTDPRSAAEQPSLTPRVTAGELSLAVPRDPAVRDVRVRFETSTDLSTWTEAGVVVVDTPEESVGSVPLDTTHRFLRARLELVE